MEKEKTADLVGGLSTSTLVHVGIELIGFGVMAYWVHSRTSNLQEQIASLIELTKKQDELLKNQGEMITRHENAIRQLYATIQNISNTFPNTTPNGGVAQPQSQPRQPRNRNKHRTKIHHSPKEQKNNNKTESEEELYNERNEEQEQKTQISSDEDTDAMLVAELAELGTSVTEVGDDEETCKVTEKGVVNCTPNKNQIKKQKKKPT
jgi:hypothetical protein